MALVSGQITTTDLSPNAGILGTQIADKTLQFRNFNEDVFKISTTLTGSLAVAFNSIVQGAGGPGTFGLNSTNSLTLPHGLSTIPTVVSFLYDATSGVYVPFTNNTFINGASWSQTNPVMIFTGGGAIAGVATYYWLITVNATNVIIRGYVSGGQIASTTIPAVTFPSVTFKIFCLEQTAN